MCHAVCFPPVSPVSGYARSVNPVSPPPRCVRICPESVRWLLTQGRTREAERLIRKMAQTNGTAISPHLLADYDTGADEEEEGGPPPLPTPSEERDTEVRRPRQGEGGEPCRRGLLWQLGAIGDVYGPSVNPRTQSLVVSGTPVS